MALNRTVSSKPGDGASLICSGDKPCGSTLESSRLPLIIAAGGWFLAANIAASEGGNSSCKKRRNTVSVGFRVMRSSPFPHREQKRGRALFF
jgi:hypothetical protein